MFIGDKRRFTYGYVLGNQQLMMFWLSQDLCIGKKIFSINFAWKSKKSAIYKGCVGLLRKPLLKNWKIIEGKNIWMVEFF